MDGKSYPIDINRIKLADFERFEQWYGESLGGCLIFRQRLFQGHPGAVRCLAWLCKRDAGEEVPENAKYLDLPADFAPIEFLDSATAADEAEERAARGKDKAPQAEGDTSHPDGSEA